MSAIRPDPPHVVMLVGNDIAVDTRVKKTAASVRRLGYRVTVVGYSAGERESASMAGCDIVRVPIPWTHKNAGRTVSPDLLAAAGLAPDPRSATDLPSRALRRLDRAKFSVIDWGTRPAATQARRMTRRVAKVAALQGIRQAGKLARRAGGLAAADRQVPQDPRLPWRETVPIALDYTDVLLPEIVGLDPDIIHAHDVHTIAAASGAAARLATPERHVPWIYDAHELIAGLSLYGRRDAIERAGWLDLEHEFAPEADAIVTVSPALAEDLHRRYPGVPLVQSVLNAPWSQPHDLPAGGGVRGALGLPPETPLLVYSGVVTAARGLATAVEAMAHLPGVHLAIVSTTIRAAITGALETLAAELGVADRVHLLPPVPAHEVVGHISSADIGLIPILRYPSHDIALTNKLFEYIHAGLPVVVSDCPAQRDFVRHEDIGAVHVTEDSTDLALAVGEVLRDLERYRMRVRDPRLVARFSWQGSEEALAEVYDRTLGARAVPRPQRDPGFPSLAESMSAREPAS